jgi:hypothetical protein
MAEKISGKVIEIGPGGDLITDISSASLVRAPRDETVRILVDDEHETFGIFPEDHLQPSMTLIAILPESGDLRLHLVDDAASMMLGVRVGASVCVSF